MELRTIPAFVKQFDYYKKMAEKAFDQLEDEDLFWQYNKESNSIGIIVKHLRGNMLSRWTDFLISDGEKEWRHRDTEFEDTIKTREELLASWEEGWNCLFNAINKLKEEDLHRIIYIRNKGQTVHDALVRQSNHYASHVGQIIYIARMRKGSDWKSLSIPKGESEAYNKKHFLVEKTIQHFSDE